MQPAQLPPLPPFPPSVWVYDVVLPILGIALGALFLAGVYRIVMRWLDRRTAAPDHESLERLEQRVAALEDGLLRVQELEERVDFLERVLAQQRQRDAGRLGEGRG
jgi:hypothetical protein